MPPQGMNLGTPPDVKQTVLNNPYQYKSKDRVEDLDIDLYEYGFRFSDQTIGRFITNNPLVNTPLNQHKTT